MPVTTSRETLQKAIDNLQQQRDELALKIHLGKAEAKEEWAEVQKKLDKLNAQFEPVKKATGESVSDVLASLGLVAEEIKRGFDRIRRSL